MMNEKTTPVSPLKVSHKRPVNETNVNELMEEIEKLKAANEALLNVIRILGQKST